MILLQHLLLFDIMKCKLCLSSVKLQKINNRFFIDRTSKDCTQVSTHSNWVVFNNHIHDNTRPDGKDCHGTHVSAGAKNVWFLNNHVS
jgi:hypothetical protein